MSSSRNSRVARAKLPQVTIDQIHRDQVKRFEQLQAKLPKLRQQQTKLHERLAQLGCPDQEDRPQALVLQRQINQLSQEITRIEQREEEILYYQRANPYLIEYYRHTRGLKRDAVERTLRPISRITFQGRDCLEAYLQATQINYTGPIKPLLEDHDELSFDAQTKDKVPPRLGEVCLACGGPCCHINQEAICVCLECGETLEIVQESDRPSYKEPPVETSSLNYQRNTHFRDWLTFIQAKQSGGVPPEVLATLEEERVKAQIPSHRVTEQMIYSWLNKWSKRKYNKYYEQIPYIHTRMTGISPPTMTPEMERNLCTMFNMIQAPYEKVKPAGRKNFLSYPFVFYKFCQLLGYFDWVERFKLLKSTDNLYEMDIIWRKVCHELGGAEKGWVYMSSF